MDFRLFEERSLWAEEVQSAEADGKELEKAWHNAKEKLNQLSSRRFLIMPYLKIGINQSKKDKLALLGQWANPETSLISWIACFGLGKLSAEYFCRYKSLGYRCNS